MRSLIVLSVSFLLLLPFGLASAGDEPVETWDRMHIGGGYSGFTHTIVRGVEVEGAKLHESVVHQELKIKRLGQTIEMVVDGTTREREDGTLVSMDLKIKQGASNMAMRFKFAGDKVDVELEQMGMKRAVQIAGDPELKGSVYAERQMRKLAGTTDQSFTYKTFHPVYQKVIETTVTSKGAETVKMHDGTSLELTRVKTVPKGLPTTQTGWIDAKGEIRKSLTIESGLNIESFRVASKAEATAQPKSAPDTPDIFLKTVVREADPIPVPRQLEAATIHVRRRNTDHDWPEIADDGHTVEPLEDGWLRIRSKVVVPPEGKTGTRPLAEVPDELKDALAPSSMIQSDAEELKTRAREIVGDETDAWNAAQKIERWVYENIKKKNMNVANASALEVCRNLEGDCTEHAALFAGLARAAGIPTRVVMGLLYLAGIWGGHAWNDVWIDGTWYPLDSTNGYGFTDPLHLPFSRMTLKDGGGSEMIQAMNGIGNFDVDIVEVVRGGKKIALNENVANLVRLKDGRYRDEIWGIRFEAPQGFKLEPPAKDATLRLHLMSVTRTSSDGASVHIRVEARDAPLGGKIEDAARAARMSGGEATTIDERPARIHTVTRGERKLMRAVVVEDQALYVFTLDRADDETARHAFDMLLQSVDFDL